MEFHGYERKTTRNQLGLISEQEVHVGTLTPTSWIREPGACMIGRFNIGDGRAIVT